MSEPEFLSTSEAAEMLGITRAGLLKQIHQKRLPARKVGTQYVIARRDLPDALRTDISTQERRQVDRAVDRVVREYGETLKKLARE